MQGASAAAAGMWVGSAGGCSGADRCCSRRRGMKCPQPSPCKALPSARSGRTHLPVHVGLAIGGDEHVDGVPGTGKGPAGVAASREGRATAAGAVSTNVALLTSLQALGSSRCCAQLRCCLGGESLTACACNAGCSPRSSIPCCRRKGPRIPGVSHGRSMLAEKRATVCCRYRCMCCGPSLRDDLQQHKGQAALCGAAVRSRASRRAVLPLGFSSYSRAKDGLRAVRSSFDSESSRLSSGLAMQAQRSRARAHSVGQGRRLARLYQQPRQQRARRKERQVQLPARRAQLLSQRHS